MHTPTARPQLSLFLRAADYLATGTPSQPQAQPQADPDISELLSALDFDRADLAPDARRNRIALLRATEYFTRIFELPLVDAPGLVFIGGEIDTSRLETARSPAGIMSVGGLGLSIGAAFQSCIGEGVEYLSQMERASEPFVTDSKAELLAQPNDKLRDFLGLLPLPGSTQFQALAAVGLNTTDTAQFPAEICLRRPKDAAAMTAPFRLSMGCAAGPTLADATLHAIFELVERDAAGLWWRGGQRGRPVNLEDDTLQGARTYLKNLRGGATGRDTWLLDITTDLEIPVAVALSCSNNGQTFAFGLCARATLEAAAIGALKELCQNELAHYVVAAKRNERGEKGLNDRDRAHLARTAQINAASDPLLQPSGTSRHLPFPATAIESTIGQLSWLLAKLAAADVAVYQIDLSRPEFAIPVVRVFAPGLQIEPSSLISSRLAHARARCTDASLWRDRVALF
jgi:ribosomal protein S12 methylthiotransferase accessory factor